MCAISGLITTKQLFHVLQCEMLTQQVVSPLIFHVNKDAAHPFSLNHHFLLESEESKRAEIQLGLSPNSLTCLEEFKFCMPSPEAIPPRVWLGSALFERGSFRLGEGKNGEVVGSSTRPPSWLEKERVSCVRGPGADSAQNSVPWQYKRAWMNTNI